MRELGMTLFGVGLIATFFAVKIYPNLEYTGVGGGHSCYGECYEEYVRVNGTVVEIEQRKKEIANADEFSSIRGLWVGCAACHGQNGEGSVHSLNSQVKLVITYLIDYMHIRTENRLVQCLLQCGHRPVCYLIVILKL